MERTGFSTIQPLDVAVREATTCHLALIEVRACRCSGTSRSPFGSREGGIRTMAQ